MTLLAHWKREGWFLRRDKTAVSALLVLLALSIASTVMGVQKVESQRAAIEEMVAADAAERSAAQASLTSHGDAAYYSFYITYDPPHPLAFAAFGQRDTAPFMKRIRLLAIEGQIYQGESPNPLLAQIGSLDLAFVAAYVLPLIVIVLLYDLKSNERAAGRQTVLEAMPGSRLNLWLPRIG
jgi:ABC-2 type transport system permease protein